MSRRLWEKGELSDSEVLKFTVGEDYLLDRRLAAFDALGSAAHAQMLAKIGLLSEGECGEILTELCNIYKLSRNNSFEVPLELEDCHTAIEVRLSELLGDAGKKIHTGRSRNDQVMVAIRLFLREELLNHLGLLCELFQVVLKKARDGVELPLPGYTHMQRAMPTTVATHLLSYAEYLLSLIRDGLSLHQNVNYNPLGVGSGFGVPLALDRSMTTELLGFDATQTNPIFVQSTRGREELKLLSWVVDIGTLIEKAAQDLLLYSTEEFALVRLPIEFTTGSSIMPQKRNPDVLELLRGQASRQRARRYEVEGIIAKLPSSYHRDFQLTKEPLFRAVDDSAKALAIFKKVLEGVYFDGERGKNFFSAPMFATHYAYQFVKEGMPFREAYQLAAKHLAEGKIDVASMAGAFLEEEKRRNLEVVSSFEESAQELEERVGELVARHEEVVGRVFGEGMRGHGEFASSAGD